MTLDPNAVPLAVLSDSQPSAVYASDERRFGQDVRRLVKLVCQAILNPSELMEIFEHILAYVLVYIPWDVEEYYLQCIKGKQDPSRMRFPNPRFGAFSEPLTVVDIRGRIVLCYLPGLLSGKHQVFCFA
jgi:hypothetical protein